MTQTVRQRRGKRARPRWVMLSSVAAIALMGGIAAAGCAAVRPLPAPSTIDDRLAALPRTGLPLAQPVTVRWNAYQVPFIEAETDGDAAFALGLVHAHLRLGQMAVVRRIVQGRISESAGPLTTDLDTAIRALDFYRPADAIYDAMPTETRRWIDRYVAGVNRYVEDLPPGALPHEFAVLDIGWERWTPQDSIALGRIAGVDFNWAFLIEVLQIEDPALRQTVMARVLDSVQDGVTTYADATVPRDFGRQEELGRFAALSALAGRTGSNSIVVGPERSASGSALIANDPHLAFIFPNAWTVAGLRSPSYSVVGMTVAGTPVFGFGRNEHLAWGGTNLRATTSQLVDVSELPPDAFETVDHEIAVRFWFDAEAVTRLSPYGPVMSELEAVPDGGAAFAVRWTGHTVTDEVTALLGAMRAQTVEEFRDAVADFAFPPQTFLVADDQGRIGSVIAARVPARPPGDPVRLIVTPERSDADWQAFYSGADLPFVIDPPAGFIASANNRPSADDTRPYGGVFPQDERIRRLNALLSGADPVDFDDLAAIQMDVVSPLSLEVVDAVRADLSRWQPRGPGEAEAIRLMLGWDGGYDVDSRAAAVFETFLTALTPAVYDALGRSREFEIYQSLDRGRTMLIEDMATLTAAQWRAVLDPALDTAGDAAEEGTVWGDLHRLRVAHVLGRIPLIGGRYEIAEIPVPGSRETVFKTDHPLTDAAHDSFFGTQSRHLSDMSDQDRNYFVLLGGQDGWINSANFADQVELWRAGAFVHVPLSREAVSQAFDRVVILRPE